ncbi:MAG: hypothetical protein JKY49_05195 [Cohaesibacteraceae bacterium]|nr:hypothetical protein [Cohaesibacteraceae bacterium]
MINIISCYVLAFVIALGVSTTQAAQSDKEGPVSGLKLPRFVSFKTDEVNMRRGPGQEFPIDWVYHRAGLPVEIIAEFELWRRIRDADGDVGWVFSRLLSGRRTAMIAPWLIDKTDYIPLYKDDDTDSGQTGKAAPNVIVSLKTCNAQWCHIALRDYQGWVEKKYLWGAYPDEIVR